VHDMSAEFEQQRGAENSLRALLPQELHRQVGRVQFELSGLPVFSSM